MNKKYFGMLLSVALVAGCASTQTTQETKEPDQEEVYIPVETGVAGNSRAAHIRYNKSKRR